MPQQGVRKNRTGSACVFVVALTVALVPCGCSRRPSDGDGRDRADGQRQQALAPAAPDDVDGERQQARALAARMKKGMTFEQVATILPGLTNVPQIVTHGYIYCSVRGNSNWVLEFTFEHAMQKPLSEYKLTAAPEIRRRPASSRLF